MDEIKDMAEALGKAVQASTVYREYLELANTMKGKPVLLKTINSLKEMQAVMAVEGQESIVPLENEVKLCSLYSEIALDEDAIAFWHSERRVLSLLRNTLETIAKQAPVNILGEYDQ